MIWKKLQAPPDPTKITKIVWYKVSKNVNTFPGWIRECINLKYIDCSWNSFTSLPSDLPDSIKYIECLGNPIQRLPDKLPLSLTYIGCGYCKLTELPSMPPSVRQVCFTKNSVRQLPENLPDSITHIYGRYNCLDRLPERLPTSLRYLDVGNNQLTSIPTAILDHPQLEYFCFVFNPIITTPVIEKFFADKHSGMALEWAVNEINCADAQISKMKADGVSVEEQEPKIRRLRELKVLLKMLLP